MADYGRIFNGKGSNLTPLEKLDGTVSLIYSLSEENECTNLTRVLEQVVNAIDGEVSVNELRSSLVKIIKISPQL